MAKVIIIGKGPAGISAALYAARAGIEAVVISKDGSSLLKADKIENYYGFAEPISGDELIENGIKQAMRLGVKFISDEVVGIGFSESLTVKTTNNEFSAQSVIIATGSSRKAPNIKNLASLEGKGVSYCAVCDGFFYRGKDVAVLGNGDFAINEATHLLPIANSVTILTNGQPINNTVPNSIKINTAEISSIEGEPTVQAVVFKDNSSLLISGLFVAYGVAGSADFAKKIGAETQNNKIIVDKNMATNIPGLFAAGDCTGDMLQIAKAVYQGAVAGTEAVKYIRSLSKLEQTV